MPIYQFKWRDFILIELESSYIQIVRVHMDVRNFCYTYLSFFCFWTKANYLWSHFESQNQAWLWIEPNPVGGIPLVFHLCVFFLTGPASSRTPVWCNSPANGIHHRLSLTAVIFSFGLIARPPERPTCWSTPELPTLGKPRKQLYRILSHVPFNRTQFMF